MTFRIAALAAAAIALIVAGCTPADEVAPTLERPKVAFEGKADEGFVGTWKTVNSRSSFTYEFAKDGKYTLAGKVGTQAGTFDNKSSGEWLVNGEHLLIKDAQGNIIPYVQKLTGDKLQLTATGSMKNQTNLVRQK